MCQNTIWVSTSHSLSSCSTKGNLVFIHHSVPDGLGRMRVLCAHKRRSAFGALHGTAGHATLLRSFIPALRTDTPRGSTTSTSLRRSTHAPAFASSHTSSSSCSCSTACTCTSTCTSSHCHFLILTQALYSSATDHGHCNKRAHIKP